LRTSRVPSGRSVGGCPPYVRTVKTSSGATAVQIVYSSRRGSREIDHLGSAHSDAEVKLLKAAARQRLAAGFPLMVHAFEGNKAETTTIVPAIAAFAAACPGQHGKPAWNSATRVARQIRTFWAP
jgi:hypothetical protein